jgi:hypothetical protein
LRSLDHWLAILGVLSLRGRLLLHDLVLFSQAFGRLFTRFFQLLTNRQVEFPVKCLGRTNLNVNRRRSHLHREQPVLWHQQEEQVQEQG